MNDDTLNAIIIYLQVYDNYADRFSDFDFCGGVFIVQQASVDDMQVIVTGTLQPEDVLPMLAEADYVLDSVICVLN